MSLKENTSDTEITCRIYYRNDDVVTNYGSLYIYLRGTKCFLKQFFIIIYQGEVTSSNKPTERTNIINVINYIKLDFCGTQIQTIFEVIFITSASCVYRSILWVINCLG